MANSLAAAQGLIVVLDGATARTDTGCVQGAAWYAAKLGSTIAGLAIDGERKLGDVLTDAIGITARMPPECDLYHPGSPSATTALIRLTEDELQYLVLGDTTVVVGTTDGIEVVNDDRVDTTARAERVEANRYPFGSAQKQAALLRMKRLAGHGVVITGPFTTTYLQFSLAVLPLLCESPFIFRFNSLQFLRDLGGRLLLGVAPL
ncbi:hypothetical protein [Micromonospora sp. KLBMP9576]|uniref:hypothetical protein n=1 Tax=Micromonospora sp. KLBMP9576 TaxID=3424769 RepID=UPI003D8A50B6